MICRECGSKKWEVIITNIKNEEGAEIDLYQCRKCKRVVAEAYHLYDEDVEV